MTREPFLDKVWKQSSEVGFHCPVTAGWGSQLFCLVMGAVRRTGSFISPGSWILLHNTLLRNSIRWRSSLHLICVLGYVGWQVILPEDLLSPEAAGPLLWVPAQLDRKMNENICKFLSRTMYSRLPSSPDFETGMWLVQLSLPMSFWHSFSIWAYCSAWW